MHRRALALAFVVLGWSSPSFGGPLAQRTEEILDLAEASLSQGHAARSEDALLVAKIYLETPVFASAWPGAERTALAQRSASLVARLAALRAFPGLVARRDATALRFLAAQGADRPTPAAFERARDEAQACVAAARVGAERDWPVPPYALTIAALLGECLDVVREAEAGLALALEVAAERDRALRELLRGERLQIYLAHRLAQGEPRCACGDGSPVRVARAPMWTYVMGPTGVLRTVETWTYLFRGDTLLSRRRVTRHDGP
jgi:hypothetical protein